VGAAIRTIADTCFQYINTAEVGAPGRVPRLRVAAAQLGRTRWLRRDDYHESQDILRPHQRDR
jgi:hypothetical protein